MHQSVHKLIVLAISALGGVSNAAIGQDDAARQTKFVIGAGIGAGPEYAGADRSRVFPVILADYQNDNGVFASATRGLGFGKKFGRTDLSAAVSYDGGRKDEKRTFGSGSDDLRGMGEIKGAALAKLHVGYDLGIVNLSVSADLAVSERDRGNSVQLAAATPLLFAAVDQVTAVLSSKYRNERSMQTWFGVTPVQSVRSGYRIYKAEGGFENVSLGVNWNHIVDRSWSINTTAGVSSMVGDAADSPIARRKISPLLISMVNYRF